MAKSNKEKILAAAAELLREKDAPGLSVRAIAAQAGTSTIGIYSHFQGKQGVLDALYIEAIDELREAMATAAQLPDPRIAVVQGLETYVTLSREREAGYRLVFGDETPAYQPGEAALEAKLAAFMGLTELVARLFPPDTPPAELKAAAMRMWALVHGFMSISHQVIGKLVSARTLYGELRAGVEAQIDDIERRHGRRAPRRGEEATAVADRASGSRHRD